MLNRINGKRAVVLPDNRPCRLPDILKENGQALRYKSTYHENIPGMLIEKLCPFIKNKKHLSDDEYFEILTGEVFQAGNGIEPVKKSWPYIRHAFANFSVDIVAHYSDSDVKRILKNKHIIRNRKKIEATIQTARVIARIKSEYGSFEAYMRSFKGDTEQFVRHLNERIYYIGASSIRNLLLCSARPTAA